MNKNRLTWLWWLLDPYKSESSKASKFPNRRHHCYPLNQIQFPSNHFKNGLSLEIGHVYKCYIEDLDTAVEIKPLERLTDENEMKAKINFLSKLDHKNIVSLIGYCEDRGKIYTLHEFMFNGSLHDHLYGPNKRRLSWELRLEICIGVARGLHYLHNEAERTIIHSNVKPAKIMLTNNWVAKLADMEQSEIGLRSFKLSETPGYVETFLFERRELTTKFDVYLFGIMLFEVLRAKGPMDTLVNVMTYYIRNGNNVDELIDPCLRGRIAGECLKKYVKVATSCVREEARSRPSMGAVIEGLEIALELQNIYFRQRYSMSSSF